VAHIIRTKGVIVLYYQQAYCAISLHGEGNQFQLIRLCLVQGVEGDLLAIHTPYGMQAQSLRCDSLPAALLCSQ
jgi:hypothetical protein